ncbi:MAG TPA: RNA 2',3'-cyclic phosphodiesterase [Bacteroidales bacterium]|nr:RNA 2',3'-cyclic phosphodiesterase [Bacteroidales bacterium]
MQRTKRLFAAVKIQSQQGFLTTFNHIKNALGKERITWVNPDNMHLTIKFFGDTYNNQIPAIDQCLKAATSEMKVIELDICNTGMFGSKYQPRVIWFGIEDGNQLQRLFLKVSGQLQTIGIYPDRQNFVPHLTIGRIKEIRDKKAFQQVLDDYGKHHAGRQRIDELVLYESILRREGPLHIPVQRYKLRA